MGIRGTSRWPGILTFAALVFVAVFVARMNAPVARGPLVERIAERESGDTPFAVARTAGGATFAQVGERFEHRAAVFLDSRHELALDEDRFSQSGWMEIADLCGAIYAVADVDVESPGWAFEILASEDGGATWMHLATLEKPHYTAYYEGLVCEDGVLSLRAAYDTDVVRTGGLWSELRDLITRAPRGEVLVTWTSRDRGRTWRVRQ